MQQQCKLANTLKLSEMETDCQGTYRYQISGSKTLYHVQNE